MNTGIENLGWGLAGRGLNVEFLVSERAPRKHEYIIPSGVQYHFFGKQKRFSETSFRHQFLKLLESQRFDFVIGWPAILHALIPTNPGRTPAFIAFLGQMPPTFFVIRQAIAFFLGRVHPADAVWSLRRLSNQVQAIVGISPATVEAFVEKFGFDTEKCKVIPRGVDLNIFRYTSPRGGKLSAARVMYAGDIHKHKGVTDLVRAVSLLNHPTDLVLCGGGNKPYLRKLTRILKSSPSKLIHLGKLSPTQLSREYSQSDVFVFPSWSEGLGKVALEAMATGCVTILSDIPGFKSFAVDGKNSVVVPLKSSESIARAISKICEDESFRNRLSLYARFTIVSSYSKAHELDAWQGLFEENLQLKRK